MALPKIQHSIFDVIIPSTDQKIKFRPMLVKEEKVLLITKQSTDRADQLNAVKQVVNNCIVSEGVDVDSLTLFDVEYLFTKIRAASISNIVKVSYKDNGDDKVYDFEIDLNKVIVKQPDTVQTKFNLMNGIALTLKYPPISLYTNGDFLNLDEEKGFETMIVSCMDKIYENDTVYKCADTPRQELVEFIESIPAKQFQEIQNFFASIPTIFYQIKYTNSLGTPREINLTSLEDFFTFG